jgi:hypothetical protein
LILILKLKIWVDKYALITLQRTISQVAVI